MDLLRDLHRNGATICMVTHDPRYAKFADRTVHMFDGRIVEVSTFSGRPTNFVVISPQCSACHALLTRLAAGETVGDPFDRQVFVSLGDTASANELLKAAGIRPDDGPVLIDEYGALRSKWGVKATPVTLMVDDQMRIRQQVRGSIIIRESPSEAQEKSAPQVFAPVGWLRV